MEKVKTIELKDDYTCFVISKDARAIEVEKLHLCSWWYRKPLLWFRRSLLEIGLQIKVVKPSALRVLDNDYHLEIEVVAPWFRQGANAADVYKAVKEKKNARFIFNEDINNVSGFDGGDDSTGCRLDFSKPICALPADYSILEERMLVKVKIPKEADVSQDPIYLRCVVDISKGRICYAKTGPAKGVYSYDMKVNHPRNLPAQYRKDEMCDVRASYFIHIVPSHYQLAFESGKTFQNVRILEYNRYTEYVKGIKLFKQKITKNKYIAVFNKSNDGKNAFFTVFESDHIGLTPIWIAILINMICSLLSFWMGIGDSCLCSAREKMKSSTQETAEFSPHDQDVNEKEELNEGPSSH